MTSYNIISWNVNGYTQDIHDWLLQYVKNNRPNLIFLSETKKNSEQLISMFKAFDDYRVIINSHDPARWHGVAMLIRKDHQYEELKVKMNIPVRRDTKGSEAGLGRIILIRLDNKYYVIGSYVPNSGISDQIKLEYRTKVWDPAFKGLLEILRQAGPTIWIGDINVAPSELDVSHPNVMKNSPGFTLQERENFDILMNNNWTDIWRKQNPDTKVYTWLGSPHRYNYGMRLDNIIISDSLISHVGQAYIISNTPQSSDHLPVGIFID